MTHPTEILFCVTIVLWYQFQEVSSRNLYLHLLHSEIRRRCEEMSSAGINPPRKQYLSLRKAEFNRRIKQLTQDKTNENVADQVSTNQKQSKKSHSENYHLENTVSTFLVHTGSFYFYVSTTSDRLGISILG